MTRVTGRGVAAWAGVVLGVVLTMLGLTVMLVLGPDNRLTTGPHAVDTDGTVVVTAPRTITWTGVRVDVLAELPAQKPVFVGIGNTVDVQSLVGETERLEITRFSTPWTPTVRQRDGRGVVQGAPTALDWWYADSAGLGGAAITTELPDEPVSLAIISVGASNLSGLQVTLAYGIRGGFAKGAGLSLLGIGVVMAALVLRRSALPEGLDDEDDVEEDEVVFVIVDEDGVERELTAAEVEAGGYEVIDEDDAPPPEPAPDPVIYVYVDDDGVEHEVSEEDLDLTEFEVVDDEESGQGGESR